MILTWMGTLGWIATLRLNLEILVHRDDVHRDLASLRSLGSGAKDAS